MNWLSPLLILVGFVGLVLGGDWLVDGSSKLAKSLGVPSLIIGLTIVAFGTSSPELAVSLQAALNGNADISIANIAGSNIFNILFIIGLASLMGPLVVNSQIIKRELPVLIGVTLLFYILSWDQIITQIEGAGLFILALVYTGWLIYESSQHKKNNLELEFETEFEIQSMDKNRKSTSFIDLYIKPIIWIIIGLLAITKGADWLVLGATQIAKQLGISESIIGATIIAIGTSLPEVAASIMATIKGERDLAIGNVIGSNIFNILAIIGICGSIVSGGIQVSRELLDYHYPVMLASCLLCIPFFQPNKTLSKPVGSLFLLGYLSYTGFLIYQALQ